MRQRQIAAGVVFKVDKAGFAVVAGDDVAAESLAEILIALMDGGDGVQSALPAGNRIGGNFDGVENIGVAQMAEHQRVGVAGEQLRHAHAGGGEGGQPLGFGIERGAAAEIGYGAQHAQPQQRSDGAKQAVAPGGDGLAGFAHPYGLAVGKGVARDGVLLLRQDGGERGGVIGFVHRFQAASDSGGAVCHTSCTASRSSISAGSWPYSSR